DHVLPPVVQEVCCNFGATADVLLVEMRKSSRLWLMRHSAQRVIDYGTALVVRVPPRVLSLAERGFLLSCTSVADDAVQLSAADRTLLSIASALIRSDACLTLEDALAQLRVHFSNINGGLGGHNALMQRCALTPLHTIGQFVRPIPHSEFEDVVEVLKVAKRFLSGTAGETCDALIDHLAIFDTATSQRCVQRAVDLLKHTAIAPWFALQHLLKFASPSLPESVWSVAREAFSQQFYISHVAHLVNSSGGVMRDPCGALQSVRAVAFSHSNAHYLSGMCALELAHFAKLDWLAGTRLDSPLPQPSTFIWHIALSAILNDKERTKSLAFKPGILSRLSEALQISFPFFTQCRRLWLDAAAPIVYESVMEKYPTTRTVLEIDGKAYRAYLLQAVG
ncbi:MAG: hypothetical protein Q8J97_13050, partial [Flavobacteriaceae bacterium]|nr:hypothetical protein [Flavobacteriaceae bacterium]